MLNKYIVMLALIALSMNVRAAEVDAQNCQGDFVANSLFHMDWDGTLDKEYKPYVDQSLNIILNCPNTTAAEKKKVLRESLDEATSTRQPYIVERINATLKKIK